MCACVVIQVVLDELEARNSHCIEAQVVSTARVAHGNGGNAQVLEGRNPLGEDGRYSGISLGVDSANLARPVVHVEIRRDQLLLRFYLQWSRGPTHELWELHLVGRRRRLGRSEVLRRVP